MQLPHLCFKILALAPFNSSEEVSPSAVAALPVDRLSLDDAMRQMECRCFLPLEQELCPAGGLNLEFPDLKSVHPDGITKTHPFFQHLQEAALFIDRSRKQGQKAAAIQSGLQQWPDLPPMAVNDPSPSTKSDTTNGSLDNLLSMVALSDKKEAPLDLAANPAREILRQAADQLVAFPRFRTMEAAWRGLRFLLQYGIPDENLRVEIGCVKADTLKEDLDALTPALINDLPGIILLDLPMDNTPLAMERLSAAAQWAAELMVPLVAWVGPDFLHIRTWDQLGGLPFIPSHLETDAYAKFRKLKGSPEAAWLCLACNRFLIRYPYGADNPPRRVPVNESSPLWISPAWALGTVLAQAVGQTGWPARFTDSRLCGLQDLALFTSTGRAPMPTEAQLDRDRLDQFARAGLTPLAAETGRDRAFFPRAVTIQGESLAYQLLLSQVTRLVLWCKDNLPAETSEVSLQTQLKLAFQVFSEQSSPPGFEEVNITAQAPGADGRIRVTFRITPAAAILPGQTPITLNLDW